MMDNEFTFPSFRQWLSEAEGDAPSLDLDDATETSGTSGLEDDFGPPEPIEPAKPQIEIGLANLAIRALEFKYSQIPDYRIFDLYGQPSMNPRDIVEKVATWLGKQVPMDAEPESGWDKWARIILGMLKKEEKTHHYPKVNADNFDAIVNRMEAHAMNF